MYINKLKIHPIIIEFIFRINNNSHCQDVIGYKIKTGNDRSLIE